MLKKHSLRMWTAFIWLRMGSSNRIHEYGNDPSYYLTRRVMFRFLKRNVSFGFSSVLIVHAGIVNSLI
jgi:hypothetical protein